MIPAVYLIKVQERSKTAIKFDLLANFMGRTTQVSGPCGLTMELDLFEDFCGQLGIDSGMVLT